MTSAQKSELSLMLDDWKADHIDKETILAYIHLCINLSILEKQKGE